MGPMTVVNLFVNIEIEINSQILSAVAFIMNHNDTQSNMFPVIHQESLRIPRLFHL
jgi:NADH:ubiquinone oxidoreductase subunit K